MKILLFGITRDIVGRSSLENDDFSDILTIGDLRTKMNIDFPELEKLNSLKYALNEEFVTDSAEIKMNDEIALIPPVSGG